MKNYLISQILFILMLCILQFIQVFIVDNKIIERILFCAIILLFLLMVFVQSYLSGKYAMPDYSVSVSIVITALFLILSSR